MNLLIDDMKHGRSTHGWDLIARNAEVAKLLLKTFTGGCVECVGIDFDMGGQCSGYDIMKWAWDNGYLPDRVEVVSLNPVGMKAIKDFLIYDAGYTLKCNIYHKKGT